MSNDSMLDSIQDSTLDDLQDLPKQGAFPPGAHRVKFTLSGKTINDKPAIEASCVMMEVVQLSTEIAEEDMPKAGDQASCLYFMGSEFGQGKFKELALNFAEFAGTRNLREIVAQVKDIECIVVTTFSKNKEDPANPYMNIKEVSVI